MKTRLLLLTGLSVASLVAAACGGRTGLTISNWSPPSPQEDAGEDSSVDSGWDSGWDAGFDSGNDSGRHFGHDAAVDAGQDAFFDSGHDAGIDAPFDAPVDAPRDSLVDAPIPEAGPPPLCRDASSPYVYAVTSAGVLLEFDPTTGTFTELAQAQCGVYGYSAVYSMGVDYQGVAYVEFWEQTAGSAGVLFRVSLLSGACSPTAFNGPASGFQAFGTGFSLDDGGASETLYIANAADGLLGAVNENTFVITPVGTISPPMADLELTGTGDGRLYAFYPEDAGTSGIALIDKATAQATPFASLDVPMGSGWAFSFWGGDFFLFTSTGATSTATRYSPGDGSVTIAGTYNGEIVGAGSSICAPTQ